MIETRCRSYWEPEDLADHDDYRLNGNVHYKSWLLEKEIKEFLDLHIVKMKSRGCRTKMLVRQPLVFDFSKCQCMPPGRESIH